MQKWNILILKLMFVIVALCFYDNRDNRNNRDNINNNNNNNFSVAEVIPLSVLYVSSFDQPVRLY